MGQTALRCRCHPQPACQLVVLERAKESSVDIDAVNCMLLRASNNCDLEGIRQAMGEGANVDTRLPAFVRIGLIGPGYFDFLDNDPRWKVSPLGEHDQTDWEPLDPMALSLTPLMHAAKEGHAEALDVLLCHHAQVNLQEADGMSALHFAAISASVDCFRILHGAGANPVAKDHFGRDALQLAPLAQIAASPSKQEWMQLFKEASCWSRPVSRRNTGDVKAVTIDHAARPAEETIKSRKIALTLSTKGGLVEGSESSTNATDLTIDEGVEEACDAIKTAVVLSTERDTEASRDATRQLSMDSNSTLASVDSEMHFEVRDKLWRLV